MTIDFPGYDPCEHFDMVDVVNKGQLPMTHYLLDNIHKWDHPIPPPAARGPRRASRQRFGLANVPIFRDASGAWCWDYPKRIPNRFS